MTARGASWGSFDPCDPHLALRDSLFISFPLWKASQCFTDFEKHANFSLILLRCLRCAVQILSSLRPWRYVAENCWFRIISSLGPLSHLQTFSNYLNKPLLWGIAGISRPCSVASSETGIKSKLFPTAQFLAIGRRSFINIIGFIRRSFLLLLNTTLSRLSALSEEVSANWFRESCLCFHVCAKEQVQRRLRKNTKHARHLLS